MHQEDAYALPEPMGERSVRTHRVGLLLAGFVFLMVLGYLGFTAFQSASAYYLTVSELTAKGTDAYDKNLRVNGTLVPTSFERDAGGTLMHFSLTDGQDTINAVHDEWCPTCSSTSTRRSCWRAPTAQRACSMQRPS